MGNQTMAEISAKDVMTLRARTQAGMMEAKKALGESNGNMDQAAELLRKWGAGRADSKMSNEMKEGLIGGKISPDGKLGVLVELAYNNDVSTAADLGALKYPDGSGRTVETVIKELVGGSIKENIAVTGLARFKSTAGQVGKYIHHNAKVGTLVQVDGSTDDVVRVLIGEIA